MADRKISDLTALTATASGDYLPIVDISEAAAASKNKRVTIQSLFQGIPVNVGIGTSSPISANGGSLTSEGVLAVRGYLAGHQTSVGVLQQNGSITSIRSYGATAGTGQIAFSTGGGGGSTDIEAVRITSSGRLLIGTSTYSGGGVGFEIEGTGSFGPQIRATAKGSDEFPVFQVFRKSRGASIVQNNDFLFQISSEGFDGTNFIVGAAIGCQVDGTPGANDMPSRLIFSTTADGAASLTERLRITSAGVLQIADAGNITVGTTTGTKIGTGTTQKIGFYNATPVAQPTAVADATDAATAITQLNALLTRMRNLGLIAT